VIEVLIYVKLNDLNFFLNLTNDVIIGFQERQTAKEGSACAYRISSEGLQLLLPYVTKQIVYAPVADFERLLKYRAVKFVDFVDSKLGDKASALLPGCCVVVLHQGEIRRVLRQLDCTSMMLHLTYYKYLKSLTNILDPKQHVILTKNVIFCSTFTHLF
jgi:hypothetical protein